MMKEKEMEKIEKNNENEKEIEMEEKKIENDMVNEEVVEEREIFEDGEIRKG